MNNLLKRLLSLTMAVVLVMSYAVMPVAADEGESDEHVHVYVEGACECGTEEPAGEPTEAPTEHTHTYDEGTVTTEATCGASGVLTKTCECSETVTETIAATGLHTYENGLCTVCTAADPDYVAPDEDEDDEPEFVACTLDENCALEDGHEEPCALGCGCPIEGGVHVEGCTLGLYVGEEETYVAYIGGTGYTTVATALQNVEEGQTITINEGTYEMEPATYDLAANVTVSGNGNVVLHFNSSEDAPALTIKASGLTWDNVDIDAPSTYSALQFEGSGTFKNSSITGMRAVRKSTATGAVVFDKCTLSGSDSYAVHFGGGNGTVEIKNGSSLTGWCSFAASLEKVTISDTTFTHHPTYNQLRFYQDAEVTNCIFPAGMTIDSGDNGAGLADIDVVFTDCGDVKSYIFQSMIEKSNVTVDNEPLGAKVKVTNGDVVRGYKTLEDALEVVAAGGTVTLMDNITLTDKIKITDGMDVTIQGEGKTIIGASGKDVFYVTGGKLTLAAGLNVVAPTDCCIYILGGEVVTNANLTKNGEKYSVIQGNGSWVGDVTIKGGTITNTITNKCAIYWPQNGKLTIEGGNITGGTGIRLSSGSLEITGGTINANGDKQDYVPSNGGSVVDTGDALMVEAIGGTSGYEIPSSVSVAGGIFNGSVGSYAATGVTPITGFITGGNFNTTLDTSLIKAGYAQTGNTVAKVEAKDTTDVVAPAPSISVTPEEDTEEHTVVEKMQDNNAASDAVVVDSIKTAVAEDTKVQTAIDTAVNDAPGATDVQFTVKIDLENVKVENGETTLQFDVVPVIQPVKEVKGEGAEETKTETVGEPVKVTELTKPITFRLPMPNGTKGRIVNITHTHNNTENFLGAYTIEGEGEGESSTNCYVQLESANFSEWEAVILPENVTTIEAELNGTKYTTLEAALADVQNNQTIVLLEDVYPASTLTIPSDKTVTIDLNGKDINTPTSGNTIEVEGTLTVKDSDSAGSNCIYSQTGNVAPVAVKGGNFTLESGALNGSMYGLRVEGGTANIQGGHITVGTEDAYGVYVKEGTLNVTDGRIDGQYMGIAGNGMNDNTTINISGGSVGASKDNGIAIYHPQGGNLNISGGTICAATGVYVKGGTISVTGGTIEGIGAKNAYNGTGNGAYSTGDAMVVENRGGNYGPLKVAISAGTFTSTNAAPITSYAASDVNAVEKFVSGGTFSGKVEPDDALVQKEHFSFKQNSDGSYSIKEDPYVEVNGDRVYGSAESAPTLDSILDENANKAGEVSISLTQGGAIHQNHTMTGSVILDANNQPILGTGSISSQAGIEISDLSNSSVSMPDGGMADFNTDSITYAPRYVSENGYGRVIVSKAGESKPTYYYLDKGASLTVTDNGKVSVTGKYILGDKDEPYYTISIAQDGLYDNRHYLGKDGDMTVTCNGFYGSVDKIWITGEEYGKDKALPVFKEGAAVNGFKVVEGSTIVTLSEEYLDSLEKGDYQIHFQYKDHDDGEYISQVFKIRTKSSGNADTTNPKTGDTILMPMFIMTISAAALAVLLIDKKKRV